MDDVVVNKTVKVQTLSCLEGWGSFMLCVSLCSHISPSGSNAFFCAVYTRQ